MRIVIAALALFALAGCGGGTDENGSTPVAGGPAVGNVAAPAGKAWTDVITQTKDGGVMQGNPDAPIKLLEYGSRSCPACAAFAMTGPEPLRAKYIATGQVSWEFREFMIHPQDVGLALIGKCVPDEAFFPILDEMYAKQPEFNERGQAIPEAAWQSMQGLPPLGQARRFMELFGYLDFMKQRGVPQAKLDQCLNDQAALEKLAERMKYATDTMKVTGTPSFYINGEKVNDAITWDQVEPALRAAGAR